MQLTHSNVYYGIQIAMMDRNQCHSETIEEINARFRRLKNKAPTENNAELSIAL